MVTNNSANIPTGASGTVLQGGGVGSNSTFSTATYPSTATGTGTILRADGTNWSATTATYPTTTTANQVLYSSAANTISGLTSANNGVLATNGSGVPSISTTPRVTAIGVGAAPGASGVTFDGTNLLNTYTTGTFTPTITFGGGSTGITYTTQTGQYWQIGAVVYVSMQIVLSNKGSSTGTAEIRGLPVTTRSGSVAVLPCLTGNIAGGGTAVFSVFLAPDASGTKGVVYLSNTAAGVTALADTNFTNTSFIDCTGFYFSA